MFFSLDNCSALLSFAAEKQLALQGGIRADIPNCCVIFAVFKAIC